MVSKTSFTIRILEYSCHCDVLHHGTAVIKYRNISQSKISLKLKMKLARTRTHTHRGLFFATSEDNPSAADETVLVVVKKDTAIFG